MSFTDERLLALPHVKRFEILMDEKTVEGTRRFLGTDYDRLMDLLRQPDVPLDDVIERMSQAPNFKRYMQAFAIQGGEINFGGLEATLGAMRFSLCHGTACQTTDELERQLLQTDIGAEAPCSFIRPPFPLTFIEFGETRSSPYRLFNRASGEHILEGVYCFEHPDLPAAFRQNPQLMASLGAAPGQPVRTLQLIFIGSPVGKSDLGDDAIHSIGLRFVDENDTVSEALERALDTHALAQRLGSPGRIQSQSELDVLRPLVAHLAKVLLYMGCDNAERADVKEASELLGQLSRVKQAKRGKVERKLTRAYDRILVGPRNGPVAAAPGQGTDAGRSMPAHWRRGHLHTVRHGEGKKLTKLKYFPPVLVRADRLAEPPSPKRYVIST